MLVKQRGALDEILTNAPVALNNLALTYNPQAGTLDTRANLGQLGQQIGADPAGFLCSVVVDQATCNQIEALRRGSAGRLPAAGAVLARARRRRRPAAGRPFDPSLGGLVEVAPMTRPRSRRSAARRWSALLLLTGCDFDVYEAAAPGRHRRRRRPDDRDGEFADVLDLVPQSTVKVNDVSVGKVTDIEPRGLRTPR